MKRWTAGGYNFILKQSMEAEKAYDGCRLLYSAEVEVYYGDELRNPDKRNYDELLVECFKREGAAPTSYTVAKFRADTANKMKNTILKIDSKGYGDCTINPSQP